LKIYSVWDANNRLSKFYSSVEQGQLAMEELAQFYRNTFYNEDFRIVTDYVYDFVYEQVEETIPECTRNHEWIGTPEYCSYCGVDRGNEQEN
jgi:hypothetical protein